MVSIDEQNCLVDEVERMRSDLTEFKYCLKSDGEMLMTLGSQPTCKMESPFNLNKTTSCHVDDQPKHVHHDSVATATLGHTYSRGLNPNSLMSPVDHDQEAAVA
jgi:hypothetical protein